MRSDETTASDVEDENSRELDDDKSLVYDGEFTPFNWEIQSKKWYWGNISKDALALAMQVIFSLTNS
jgi:hypothetical protein